MAAVSVEIADGLVAWLNDQARAWPLAGWTAVRTWAPAKELPALDDEVLVEVVPGGLLPEGAEVEEETRCGESQVFAVQVSVRQRYPQAGAIPLEWLDARAELAEAIADRVRGAKLAAGDRGGVRVCEQSVVDPFIDAEDLTVRRSAVSVVETLWRDYRGAA